MHQVGRLPRPRGWWKELHAGGPGRGQKPRGVQPHPAPHWSPWRRGPLSPAQLWCCDTEVLMAGQSALPNKELPALLHGSCFIWTMACLRAGVPGGSDGKESACSAGDPGSVPGSGKSPGEGHGYPLQYSCLENPMDRGAEHGHD